MMIRESTVMVMNKVDSSILCVIDFSEASKEALQAAINIAGSTRSRLTVLYPYRLNQPRHVPDVAQWKRTLELDATNNFNRMTKSLFKEAGIAWEFKAEVGFVDDRVEAFAEKNSVGVVVMSADLAHTSDGAFLDILEKLTCPLLIVPKKQQQES